MTTDQKLLKVLLSASLYVSGEELAKKLNITRASVWKAINKLRCMGYNIDSKNNRGYKIINDSTSIIKEKILNRLNDKTVKVIVLSEVSSTNEYAKQIAPTLNGNTCIIVAERQLNGKGRLNRQFYSPVGKGIYLSVVLFPNVSIADGVKTTTYTAVKVANAIESFIKEKVGIKWVNDLYINGKKVCGILSEANCNFELNKLGYVIIGIGINVLSSDFPAELNGIATSIEDESGAHIDRNELIAEIVNSLSDIEKDVKSGEYIKEYISRSIVIGKTVKVISLSEEYFATVKGITETGGLIVDVGGQTKTINAGEVSLKT